MTSVIFEVENATFEFDRNEVRELLNRYISEHKVDEAIQILDFISISSDSPIETPKVYDYFGYIALDLMGEGKGSARCKTCNQTYKPDDLKPTVLGHGESPFSVNLKKKGGIIKSLFGKKQRLPAMFGGKGYQCPQGHELISMVTWMT